MEILTVSRNEAASLLDVSPRTITAYFAKGILRSFRRGRSVVIPRDDVLALKVSREGNHPIAVNASNVGQLYSEVRQLRREVDLLKRVLDLRGRPMGLEDGELRSLHQAATTYAERGWPVGAEGTWADVFLRLTGDELRRLRAVDGHQDPWQPFVALVTAMIRRTEDEDMKAMLCAGLHHLMTITAEFIEKEFGPRKLKAILRLISQKTTQPRHSKKARAA